MQAFRGIATARRDDDLAPIVFLHGFGSTKEDYVDLVHQAPFAGPPFLAYDAPGCGESACERLSKLSIPFLVETAQAVLRHAGIDRFHLVGHSMGGLTALMLAHQAPDRVLSFIDIEGNVAPEDCAVRGIFESIVHLSDHADLMSKFLALPCPRMFMYGEQNDSLSYLGALAANDIEVAEIPHSGHFPMYSNPVAMWARITKFPAQNSLD